MIQEQFGDLMKPLFSTSTVPDLVWVLDHKRTLRPGTLAISYMEDKDQVSNLRLSSLRTSLWGDDVETPILKAGRRPRAPLGMNEFLEEGQKRVAMGLLRQGGGEQCLVSIGAWGSRDRYLNLYIIIGFIC